ncbi:isopentenyl-diphosphate delta-isomerase [Rhodotorula toruloides]|uniref:isopentenyl-diphosphate Delta-isomerase n=1 Tax=Rhodotorula toruloides TaxID=5286 RepID=A0A2Z6EYV6_RHOTO|nr:isopentenyl diphosphate isomerase [Rhodotorula toruloides]GEM08924.1 isopentenyl-diphosphate delta-isomerase [Rhodotorula toruloides]
MSSTTHTITLDPSKYDQEQIKLMEERLILLDNEDRAIGEGSKKDCHLIPPADSAETRSPLHRAFSVFLFHPETGKLLLQRRADEKITFPKMWTNTCCSHPLTSFGEMDEEGQIGVRRAAARKLAHELGIPHTYPLDDFAYLTRIHYYAPSDEIWAEHEIDYIFFLTLDPKTDINPNEVSDVKWVSKADLEEFFKDPSSTFTPWFRLIAESFLYKWWDALLASRKDESQPLDAKALIAEAEDEKATMGSIIRM